MKWLHIIEHALLDTLKLFPFLLVIFILIEVFEQSVSSKKYAKLLGGKGAPLVGAVTGVIPQCGFSVMGVKLFQERCITVGTLLAVFISTSDEAVSILISRGMWKELLLLVGVKFLIGTAVGYLADFLIGKKDLKWEEGEPVHCDCGCGHSHEGKGKLYTYFVHPLLHCSKTVLFIFIVNVVLGGIIELVGEEAFASFMSSTGYLQPLVAALVGLIPNCASSVVIVELFISGSLTFGALVAGLTANAGIGLALLLKDRKHVLRNVYIILTLYVTGVVFGEVITLISAFIG